jgi:cell shape-determining protein MreC
MPTLIPLLAKAVQEQQVIIENQASSIDQQMLENQFLRREMQALRTEVESLQSLRVEIEALKAMIAASR